MAAEVTATKIYVNVAMPDKAEQAAELDVDGVGLLRAELILEDALQNRHPRDLIAHGEQDSLVDSLATAVGRVAAAFGPRPVVYRASDFRTNEFRNLKGGEEYEPEEHNPMIGYRGCYRYVSNPDLFNLELAALARVREQNPNLHLMIPFVRTKWELEECLELVDASPLGRQRGLHRWVMAEVPSVVYWLPEYVGHGCRRGVDRQQRSDPADARGGPRLRPVRRVVRRVRRRGARRHRADHHHRTQAGHHRVAVRPGAVEQAGLRRTPCAHGDHVHLGDPRRAQKTRHNVAAAERRLLLESARGRDGDRG